MPSKYRELGRILIADDDDSMLALLENLLEKENFRVETCRSLDELKAKVRQFSFDCVLLDLFLGEENTVAALPFLAREAPFCKVIIMTAYGSIDLAVEAMHLGASSFVAKGSDPSRIIEELKKRLGAPVKTIVDTSSTAVFKDLGLIGGSSVMQELFSDILRIKDSGATVLIQGESGTGKELVARAIHRLSKPQGSMFAAINCAAIPETLLESELFGHKKGAFTDAKTERKGIFESCDAGTLFLDEIGDMPLALQTKVLRVLQEKEIVPIGANSPVRVNTHVITATHRDLEEEIACSKFREDLYFRINVLTLYVPALRERRGDIPLLANSFIERFNERYNKTVRSLSAEMAAKLDAYDWPGNVRELQNSIERAVVLAGDDHLKIEDILRSKAARKLSRTEAGAAASDSLSYAQAKEQFERSFLLRILKAAKGSITEAARISGRYRSDIYRLMERYQINPDEFKS